MKHRVRIKFINDGWGQYRKETVVEMLWRVAWKLVREGYAVYTDELLSYKRIMWPLYGVQVSKYTSLRCPTRQELHLLGKSIDPNFEGITV